MGKNLYVHIEPEEVVMYESLNVDLAEKGNGQKTPILPAYKVLSVSTLYFIDEENYLSLFHLKRDKQNIVQAYKENWLFHSSYSPLWRERIIEHCGIIDTKKKLLNSRMMITKKTFTSDMVMSQMNKNQIFNARLSNKFYIREIGMTFTSSTRIEG